MKKNDVLKLGERNIEAPINPIRACRMDCGLTPQEMSDLLGIPKRTIEDWEAGRRACPDYVEKLVLDKLMTTFKQPDHKTILEEILSMLEGDLKHLKTDEAQKYVTNVISEIKDALK